MNNSIKKIAVFQPLVPLYRIPFFESLGKYSQYEFDVYCGASIGSLRSISHAENYQQIYSPVKNFKLMGIELKIQLSHLTFNVKNYDVVVASWDSRYITLLFVILKCKFFRTPIILWGHGYSKSSSGIRDKIRNIYGHLSDANIVYSLTLARRLVNEQNYASDKVYVAQNAIDHTDVIEATKHWLSDRNYLLDFQRKYNLDKNKLIIFVSRLESDNHIEMMFPVLFQIKKKYESCKLVIVGDGAYMDKLKSLAEENDVSDAVIFTGSIYEQMELAPWIEYTSCF